MHKRLKNFVMNTLKNIKQANFQQQTVIQTGTFGTDAFLKTNCAECADIENLRMIESVFFYPGMLSRRATARLPRTNCSIGASKQCLTDGPYKAMSSLEMYEQGGF